MAHIKNITINNFKTFQNEEDFEFAPITILTGTNSSGKSNLIKALLLLRNSIKEHSYLQTLAFNNNKKLGDFEGSLSHNNYGDNQMINFRFPFHLDYFKGEFFIELHFEKEESGLTNNGRLARIEIFKEESIKTTLLLFSAKSTKVNWDSEVYTDPVTNSDALRPVYDIKVDFEYQINLSFIIGELEFNRDNLKEHDVSIANESNDVNEALSLLKKYKEEFDRKKSKQNMANKNEEPYIGFYDKTVSRKLQLQNDTLYPYNADEKSIKLFDPKLLLFEYWNTFESGSDDEIIKRIALTEKNAIDKLSMINTDFSVNSYSYKLLQHSFFTDDFLREFIIDRVEKKVDAEISSLKDILVRMPSLTRHASFLIDECLINNVERGFKKLKETLSVDYLGPIRSDQSRAEQAFVGNIDVQQLIDDYIGLKIYKDKTIHSFVNYWLIQLNVGEGLFFQSAISGLVKILLIHKNGRYINIADLGFGVSQIIPVLLRIAVTAYKSKQYAINGSKPNSICIEEPESNLHPALQSKLADLFIDAADMFNIQFIIETHSEYLIRKMQYWVAKKIIEPRAASIYYFHDPQNIPEREKQIKRINIREDGMLEDDFGEGFYDEATRLTFELLKIQSLN